jgi:hypothetical protein
MAQARHASQGSIEGPRNSRELIVNLAVIAQQRDLEQTRTMLQ